MKPVSTLQSGFRVIGINNYLMLLHILILIKTSSLFKGNHYTEETQTYAQSNFSVLLLLLGEHTNWRAHKQIPRLEN